MKIRSIITSVQFNGKNIFFFLTKPGVIKACIRASISLQVADILLLEELSDSFSFCCQQKFLMSIVLIMLY